MANLKTVNQSSVSNLETSVGSIDVSAVQDAAIANASAIANKADDPHNHVVADITDYEPVEYMTPIWAEENSTLAAGNYEWAFGNGANTPADGGIRIFVPAGWSCELVGMSLQIGSGSAEVRVRLNQSDTTYTVSTAGTGGGSTEEFTTPLAISDNDKFNFRTVAAASTSSPHVVCAWLRYYK